jgi:hypothetical protein
MKPYKLIPALVLQSFSSSCDTNEKNQITKTSDYINTCALMEMNH